MDFGADRHHVWADAVRLQQVFWNLINNAVEVYEEEWSNYRPHSKRRRAFCFPDYRYRSWN